MKDFDPFDNDPQLGSAIEGCLIMLLWFGITLIVCGLLNIFTA